MDTKLKKTRKITAVIIALCVLVPAIVLVAFYPRMERTFLEKKAAYENENSNVDSEIIDTWLDCNVVNYLVEATYCMYGEMLQEANPAEKVRFDVLDEYNWTKDYYYVTNTDNNMEYWAGLTVSGESLCMQNAESDLSLYPDMDKEAIIEQLNAIGKSVAVMIEYDSFGRLADVSLVSIEDIKVDCGQYELFDIAQRSIEQYADNAAFYKSEYDETIDEEQMHPKNFTAVFLLDESSMFIYEGVEYEGIYNTDEVQLYLEIGALVLVLILAACVALAAIVLPFIKGLRTGWEKLFSMPFEAVVVLFGLGLCGAAFMYCAMCYTNVYTISEYIASNGAVEFLGFILEPGFLYNGLRVLNVIGWALCFFAEYIVVASARQFFCGPIYYVKHRFLIVVFFCFIKKQAKRLCDYVTDIDITEKLNNSIIKIVLVNFVVLAVLCCMWFLGLPALIVYSVALYVLLRKYGEKLQKQYYNILNVTKEMSNGNLKCAMDEELGIFEPLGNELSKVQQGFAKAVAEEAKSQNMKTELITNVSHDLKTPLTAIITYVDLLKKEDLTEEERASYIETLDQKSQRLKVLIEDLFEVSKANSGNVQMHLMDVDVVNLMKQVRLEMEDKIAGSDLQFRWNLPEEKVVLSLDGQRTYRIFENLLNNVLKYAMPHSRVYIDLLQSEDEVKIIFRNMSAIELHMDEERLTERFVRGDASRNSEGSGLGLAIVKSFVELQNGAFHIEVDGDLFKAVIVFPMNKK